MTNSNSNYIYSDSPLRNLSGNLTGAHLYMEVNVPFGGGIQAVSIYANSAEAAGVYLRNYARYAEVGHWTIGTVDGCGFSVFEKGNYEYRKAVRELA